MHTQQTHTPCKRLFSFVARFFRAFTTLTLVKPGKPWEREVWSLGLEARGRFPQPRPGASPAKRTLSSPHWDALACCSAPVPVPLSLGDRSRAPGFPHPLGLGPRRTPFSCNPVPNEKGSKRAKTAITATQPSAPRGLPWGPGPALDTHLPPPAAPAPAPAAPPPPAPAPGRSAILLRAGRRHLTSSCQLKTATSGANASPSTPRTGRRGGAVRPRDPPRPGEG